MEASQTPLQLPGKRHGKLIVASRQSTCVLLKDYQHDPTDGRDIEQLGGMCGIRWDQRLDSYMSHTCLILDLQTFYENIHTVVLQCII